MAEKAVGAPATEDLARVGAVRPTGGPAKLGRAIGLVILFFLLAGTLGGAVGLFVRVYRLVAGS